MAFLLCGSEGGQNKENVPGIRPNNSTPQCFGLMTASQQTQVESFTVPIMRGENGFGFTVTGSNPAKIKAVKQESAAYLAGLRKGDSVIRINGANVSGFLAESVAKIVRESKKRIALEIERKCRVDTSVPQTGTPAVSSTLQEAERIVHRRLTTGESSKVEGHFDQEQDLVSAVDDLIHCEKQFLAQVHFGSQRYSAPLRRDLISPTEHVTLFQNVEKLVTLSEYHLRKLELEVMGYTEIQGSKGSLADIIGSIYLPKSLMMSDVFEQYCNGIQNSFRLLAELRKYEEFETFLPENSVPADQPTISDFIRAPLEHLRALTQSLQHILSQSQTIDSSQVHNLAKVVDTLRQTCNRVNENNTRRSVSMTSLVSRSSCSSRSSTSSRASSRSSLGSVSSLSSDGSLDSSSSSSASPLARSAPGSANSGPNSGSSPGSSGSFPGSIGSPSSSIGSSVDPDVMDIQSRLIFSDDVQPFQLATATRHMIYAGEMTHVGGDQLYIVLLSDLLLLTKLEIDDRLLLVENPILLQDIVNTEYGQSHSLEVCLTTEFGIDEDWVEECDVILTAPSLEQKYTWKNILDQRIKSCQVQRDFLNAENFF